jgi:hypothetical protein
MGIAGMAKSAQDGQTRRRTLLRGSLQSQELLTSFPPLPVVVSGSCDRSFADASDLHLKMGTELLLLIEALEGN